jgi:hypothetical protein
MSNTDILTEALVKFKKQRFRLEEADEGMLYLLGGRGNKELV